jgi:hypothetical protein
LLRHHQGSRRVRKLVHLRSAVRTSPQHDNPAAECTRQTYGDTPDLGMCSVCVCVSRATHTQDWDDDTQSPVVGVWGGVLVSDGESGWVGGDTQTGHGPE